MKKTYLLVDAYNMIGQWPELVKLKKADKIEDARDLLLQILSNYHKQTEADIIVVFDAQHVPGIAKSYQQYQLEVVFTGEGQTADSYIEELAGKLQTPLTIVSVATNDQAEQWAIFSKGAIRLTGRDLHQDIERMNKEVSSHAQEYQDQASVRRSPWSDNQLEKLALLRDDLSD